MAVAGERIYLRRVGRRGRPDHEAYRVERLHNRREPLVGSELSADEVDDLVLRTKKPFLNNGRDLTVTISNAN